MITSTMLIAMAATIIVGAAPILYASVVGY